MATLVEVPGHGQVEFPDGMDNDQIAQAIQSNFPDLKSPQEDLSKIPAGTGSFQPSQFSGGGSVLDPGGDAELTKALGSTILPHFTPAAKTRELVADVILSPVRAMSVPLQFIPPKIIEGAEKLAADVGNMPFIAAKQPPPFKPGESVLPQVKIPESGLVPGADMFWETYNQAAEMATPGNIAFAAAGALKGRAAPKPAEIVLAPRTAEAVKAIEPPKEAAIEVKQPDPAWQVTVQNAIKLDEKNTVPGYVQIDDIAGGKNNWSAGPDKLKAQGYEVPDFSTLPSGKYTFEQAKTLLEGEAKTNQNPAPTAGEVLPPAPLATTPEAATVGIRADIPIIGPAVEALSSPEFWKKHFTAEGSLPKEVYDKWVEAKGQITAETRGINYNVRDLYSGLREVYGISKARELAAGMRDVPPEAVQQINSALLGEIPVTNLPREIQAPVEAMRSHVDKLSRDLIDRGLVDGDLAVKVGDNLGTYLTRSYRIFDDPKWVEKIPPEIRQNAETYLQGTGLTPEQSVTKLRELLADWSDSGLDKQFRGGKLGAKDLSQFMQRKELAPEIRAVLGEYKDPVINYARSVTKIADFIGKQEFLASVKQMGMGRYLFEEGQSRPGFEAKLAAEQSSTMSPLNGLRTSPAIKEAFETFDKNTKATGLFGRMYFALNAASKAAKTVFSPLTQNRNLMGQPFFNLWNGHFDFTQYGKSIKAIAADIGLTNDPTWRAYYQRLKELGITHESAKAEELRATLKDAGMKDLDYENLSGHTMARAIRKTMLDVPARAYQVSDELGKIVGFENEKAMLTKAHPDWTPTQVEKTAAERVRNGYPTYSKVPNIIKELRKQPVVGPFIAFPYEVMRTSFHTMRYAMEDISSGNPVQVKAGVQRMAGIMTVLSSGLVLSQISKAFLGISGKKEDDVRRFLPSWDKNAQLIFTDKDNAGEVGYINWSYENPYSYLIDPMVAMFSNNEKDVMDKTVAAFGEFFRPFVSEQMLYAAITDVQRNKTQRGTEVYNPQDTPDEKMQKSLAHILTAIEPGLTYRMRTKIIPAATQDQPDYGRKLDLGTELTSELTGIKRQRLDFKQALTFKTKQFSEDISNANYLFTGKVGKTGTVTEEQLVDSYETANEQRLKLWTEMARDVQAVLRNGVSAKEAKNILRASGLSIADADAIIKGEYTPLKITDYTRERAKKFNRKLPAEQIRSIRENYLTNPPALLQK